MKDLVWRNRFPILFVAPIFLPCAVSADHDRKIQADQPTIQLRNAPGDQKDFGFSRGSSLLLQTKFAKDHPILVYAIPFALLAAWFKLNSFLSNMGAKMKEASAKRKETVGLSGRIVWRPAIRGSQKSNFALKGGKSAEIRVGDNSAGAELVARVSLCSDWTAHEPDEKHKEFGGATESWRTLNQVIDLEILDGQSVVDYCKLTPGKQVECAGYRFLWAR